MLFMSYKPKAAKNVKAEQVTVKNINEIAASFAGTARVFKEDENNFVLKIATFDGPLEARVGQWVVRNDDLDLTVMDDSEFTEKYEKARTTREG